jgi:outer membrane protein OmpA-like peptidoglycan-associated protein
VRDAVTGKATESQVTIKDVNTGLTVFSLRTDKDGAFLSGITAGKNYACIVEKDGYRYYAHNFDLSRHLTIHKPYYLDIKLIPLDKVSPSTPPVVLQNIFFHTGSAELLPQSQTEIDLLYQLLTKKPDLGIKIIGHTDNVGQDSDNLSLSLARAASVVKALVEKGIEKTRLKAEGKGETMPIAPNDTEEGRQKNRRTEFEVYNMKN